MTQENNNGSKKFKPTVFFITFLTTAVILVSFLAIPQWLMMNSRWETLRHYVAETANHAAAAVDGDLQHQLDDPANYNEELYNRALAPLVRLHSSDKDITYAYTMVVRDGSTYFVLDTANSPELKTNRKLEPSTYMEKFELSPEYEDNWLKTIASGKTYVTPTFQTDKYGTFLSGHAPIYDSKGAYSGFVGVDYDVAYYNEQELQYTRIATYSIINAIILSLIIGYGFHEYYYWGRP
jgi:hypothetical protein